MDPKKKYYILVEYNYNEGETWMFTGKYIIDSSSEEWDASFEKLDNILNEYWTIHWNVEEYEIKVLEKYLPQTNYMNPISEENVISSLEQFKKALECEECIEEIKNWYKGPTYILCDHNEKNVKSSDKCLKLPVPTPDVLVSNDFLTRPTISITTMGLNKIPANYDLVTAPIIPTGDFIIPKFE